MVVAVGLAVVAADIQGEVMIVPTTVDHILHLEEEAIVVVTEVEPEGMRLTEICEVTGGGAVQKQKCECGPIDCTPQPWFDAFPH